MYVLPVSAKTKFVGGRGRPSTSSRRELELAFERQAPHSALALVEMGKQEGAVRQDGEAVRLDRPIAADERLRAVGPDARYATAPVGDEYVALRGAVNTLGPVEVMAELLHLVEAARAHHASSILRPSSFER